MDKTSAERQRRYIQRLKDRAFAEATANEITRRIIERAVWAATGRSPSPEEIEIIEDKMKSGGAA